MNRSAYLCAVLFACGGSKPAPSMVSDLGTATHASNRDDSDATGGGAVATAKPDPHREFRQHYTDPGGMWMPSQMTLPQHVENFQNMGVHIDATKLADPLAEPLAAVVSLGGCTGSLVSSEGLVVTNHHCVQGALEYNSNEKENLIETGFLAKTHEDEKSAGPAARVMVVQAYSDVTKQMRDGLDAIKDPTARKDESDKRQKQLISACEKDRPGIRCQVSGFFRGGLYQLIEMLEIRDVRLVYVPARSVGDYGGEIDNWEWPRHTGDWSFYRAYVGADGKPADYSPTNVPFHPKHWLRVSTAGLKPGDFVMVTGYPGSTDRSATAAEIHHDLEWYYPYLITYYDERYKLAEAHPNDADKKTVEHATTLKQGIQNGLEKFRGIVDGMKKGDLQQRKDDLDKRTREWAAQPGHEAYKQAIDKLDAILEEEFRTARVHFDRSIAFGGSRLMTTALSLNRWAEERAKKDPDRKPGYQNRDMPRALAGQEAVHEAVRRDARSRGVPVVADARVAAARCRPTVARDAARHEEGPEDRRGADR